MDARLNIGQACLTGARQAGQPNTDLVN